MLNPRLKKLKINQREKLILSKEELLDVVGLTIKRLSQMETHTSIEFQSNSDCKGEKNLFRLILMVDKQMHLTLLMTYQNRSHNRNKTSKKQVSHLNHFLKASSMMMKLKVMMNIEN